MQSYDNKITIKHWAEEDRPREKLLLQGRRALTDAELIAILISSGNITETAVELSKRILHQFNNDLSVLGKQTVSELCKFKGIGEAKAIAIIAGLELGRRRQETAEPEVVKITNSKDIFNLLNRYFSDIGHEEFWIILLSQANKVTHKFMVSTGGKTSTVTDPKIVYKLALENNATGIVLAHNHPSGNLKPSQQDIKLTNKMVEAGKLLDIRVIDHVIFGENAYFSFADQSMLG
ncbi:MAG: DNA repair protein RadC [Sphingobacteriales bacterium]|nr:MAG: DNA repair protein RadC [Sphingobacteriales bacterium]